MPAPPPSDPKQQAIDLILHDPVGAHLYFFEHRHTDLSPEFHTAAIEAIWNYDIQKYLSLIFRGGAKSTLMEEATTLMACLGAFKHALIVGDTESRAADRLTAIKHELETNERLLYHFGPLQGEPWGYTQACLSSNIMIRAFGRNQKLRGIKYLDSRPDFLFLDDIEDEESVNSEEQIEKTMRWVMSVVIPSMDRYKRIIRMAATVIHPNACCVQFSKDASWITHKVPVWYYNEEHTLVSSWEDRFPLQDMLSLQREFERMGKAREFSQEYLCEAESSATKAFDVTHVPVDLNLHHTFEPTIILVDPARTTKATSSLTGFVVISWVNQRLIIWEAEGLTIRPSDIIDRIFELDARFNPVFIGVEKDGLEEFIMQPLRDEMARRQTPLPIVPIKAPRGKLEFIRGLQPYLSAGEVIAAKPVPLLQAQLQNFPAGKIDTLNALAYALQMHPGEPVYQHFVPDEFVYASILEELPKHRKVIYAINATSTCSAGAALTLFRGKLAVLLDTVIEGPPVSAGPECASYLRNQVERPGSICIPRSHEVQYDTLGLRSSLYAMGERPGLGGDPVQSRVTLQQKIDGRQFVASDEARWTLRALTAGYAYAPNSREPKKNNYAVLMAAIEAAIPVLIYSEDGARTNAIDRRSGRPYLSSRPQR